MKRAVFHPEAGQEYLEAIEYSPLSALNWASASARKSNDWWAKSAGIRNGSYTWLIQHGTDRLEMSRMFGAEQDSRGAQQRKPN